MADPFEYSHWSQEGVVAVDDSYGRYGVWVMETESFTRKEICIALLQYIILRLNYISKTEMIFSKFKRETNVQVIVLWLFGGYKETKEEEK